MKDDFGALLSKSRASAGMSLRALQDATRDKKHKKGLSIGLLSMIENGERPITYKACLRIATVLSLDIQTALSAAYRSRVNHSAKRERETLKAFIKQRRLGVKLDIDD